MAIIVKTNKDADAIKLGDSYIIDGGWPDPSDFAEDAEAALEKDAKADAEYERLNARVQKAIVKNAEKTDEKKGD